MQISPQCLQLLKSVECLHLKPYDDQTSKPISEWCPGATIGYGHLIPEKNWAIYKNGIDEHYADLVFENDLRPAQLTIDRCVNVRLSQQQYDALVMMIFNIGCTAFSNSSLLKLINDSKAKTHYATLDDAWKAFNKSQGKFNRGLINRRLCELTIWYHGIYAPW